MSDLDDLEAFLADALAAQKARRVRRPKDDYPAKLAEKARLRALLNSSQFDGERFRFWFTRIDTRFSLDEWRKRIDDKINRSPK